MSDKYLFRISTKKADVWSNKKPKPVYFVASSKAEAEDWASRNLQAGLAVASISCLGSQIATSIFVGV